MGYFSHEKSAGNSSLLLVMVNSYNWVLRLFAPSGSCPFWGLPLFTYLSRKAFRSQPNQKWTLLKYQEPTVWYLTDKVVHPEVAISDTDPTS